MARSIRIVCTGLVFAFTVGLGSGAVAGASADRSGGQRTAASTGFDWDIAPAAPPAQS
ncbi:hypothetical protein [Kitasatospora griseola]|uniref:hypothetical protein n=1 Tax=Kitasatospora griseola TaxID=2064 RepID=UPI000ABDDA52|nr:hypothetical protein [Kitasatospora griseola]GGQ85849.1 hypothetical protein GCM10010195_46950 [Kitasatospora griseola]